MKIALVKEHCCGCTACYCACPTASITMQSDQEGFLYPVIDSETCIECGLCEKVCPMLGFDEKVQGQNQPKVFGGWNRDNEVRMQSSSGGVFTALAKEIIEQGGVVVGAAFDTQVKLKHIVVNCVEDLALLRGSKYLQSDVSEVLLPVREYLEKGSQVLFTGTPCQVAGLYTFLKGKQYENLITCDLVCHGVPSPMVFEKYKEEEEKKAKQKIHSVLFRDKSKGWKSYCQSLVYSNTEKLLPAMQTSFMRGFLGELYLRPSCHLCPFMRIPRVGDITLGDYWGVANYYPELDDDKGTSLLMINSSKGEKILDKVSRRIFVKQTTLESALAGNRCLIKPVKPHKDREQFFREIENSTLNELIEKYCPRPNFLRRVFNFLYRVLSKTKRGLKV